jgi:hypothetical protein
MHLRNNLCWALSTIALFPAVQAAENQEIPAPATGLLVGTYDPDERSLATARKPCWG